MAEQLKVVVVDIQTECGDVNHHLFIQRAFWVGNPRLYPSTETYFSGQMYLHIHWPRPDKNG